MLWYLYNENGTRQQNCGNDLYVDGVRQFHSETVAELDQPGEFYFDEVANRIWVYDNPEGKTVEAVVVPHAFFLGTGIDDVRIEGFTVMHYGSPVRPAGAIHARFAKRTTLQWMTVGWNHASGFRGGTGTHVSNCRFIYNGLSKILIREKRDKLYKDAIKFIHSRVELDLASFTSDIWSH